MGSRGAEGAVPGAGPGTPDPASVFPVKMPFSESGAGTGRWKGVTRVKVAAGMRGEPGKAVCLSVCLSGQWPKWRQHGQILQAWPPTASTGARFGAGGRADSAGVGDQARCRPERKERPVCQGSGEAGHRVARRDLEPRRRRKAVVRGS